MVMVKKNILYVLLFLFFCTACSPQKVTGIEESGSAIIPVLRYDSVSGRVVGYETPVVIPESILHILQENIKDENSNDPYYRIWRELSGEGFNPLRLIDAVNYAIATGNTELVKEIFKYYVNFTNGRWGQVNMRMAAETGSLEMVKFLFDAGVKFKLNRADYWYTDFSYFAAHCPNPDVIRFLIERGEDINETTTYCGNPVNHAAEYGKAENLRILLAAGASFETFNWNNVTALMLAGKKGHDECVQILLDAGADIEAMDADANTALMAAAESGNERSVRLLLEAGAGKNINAKNTWGSTALMEAAINGNAETVQTLIAAGADVNAGTWEAGSYAYTPWYLNSKGLTALMLASTGEAVKALLAGGADVNAKDSDGNNAIYYQCFFQGKAEIIDALIKAGSYLYLDVNKGRDLLRLSREWPDWKQTDEIITMLEKAGCVDDDPDGEWPPYFYYDGH